MRTPLLEQLTEVDSSLIGLLLEGGVTNRMVEQLGSRESERFHDRMRKGS